MFTLSDFGTKRPNFAHQTILQSTWRTIKTTDKVTTATYKFQTTNKIIHVVYVVWYFVKTSLEGIFWSIFILSDFDTLRPNFAHPTLLRSSLHTAKTPVKVTPTTYKFQRTNRVIHIVYIFGIFWEEIFGKHHFCQFSLCQILIQKDPLFPI